MRWVGGANLFSWFWTCMRIWQYSPSIWQYLTLATPLFHWLAGETFDKQGLFRGTTLSGFTGSFDMSAAPMQRITYNLEMSLPLMDSFLGRPSLRKNPAGHEPPWASLGFFGGTVREDDHGNRLCACAPVGIPMGAFQFLRYWTFNDTQREDLAMHFQGYSA